MNLQKRLYFLLPAVTAALLHNIIHESVHYLAARLLGEGVKEFRFLTNGWGSSQVIYATPAAERIGAHWLVIAWGPAVVTTLIGYLLYLKREEWLTRWPLINATLWYAGLFFLCLDPFYFALLSLFFGGDVNAVDAVGWSPWPVRLVALGIFIFNARLMVRWQREARARPERYVIAG
ncbi:MAG: hypothetical protein H5T64_09680 [Chloroflexi bacterium]|nr:hypothetical protein [Chloroflexota bacterium]